MFPVIQGQDIEWYTALTSNLTEAQVKSLGEICLLADQRLAARESKKIEQQGGKFINITFFIEAIIYNQYIFFPSVYSFVFSIFHFKCYPPFFVRTGPFVSL